MNRSLLHYALLTCLFLFVNSFSSHAQILLTKNTRTDKRNAVSYGLPETMAASQQPNATAFANKLNAEGLRFTENKGQVADLKGKLRPDVLFTAHNGGAKLFLTTNGICYQFSRQFLKKELKDDKMPPKFSHPEVDSTQFYRVDVKLVGANLHPDIVKEGEGSGVENFYLAHCPSGILNVRNYSKITYKNVYPNIDWVVYSKEGKLEYDFVVNPGGKISDIKLKYDGAEKIGLDKKGAVTIETRLGSVSEHKPISYQQGKGIESSFVLDGSTLSFAVKDYDKNQTLTIDPSIVWSTYYGGRSLETGYSCAADRKGNVYLGGLTASADGIAGNGFQSTFGGGLGAGGYDGFLVKFDSSGARLWATYYGGEANDEIYSCAPDSSGNIYAAGTTSSQTGIAYNGFQNTYVGNNPNTGNYYSGGDGFLVKFDSLGARIWATYYGGENDDYVQACATDGSGNVYITGSTSSTTGIAFSNSFQNALAGRTDGFLVKFDSSGARLWATYYGGKNEDYASWMAVDDASGNMYITGATNSTTGIAYHGFKNVFTDSIGAESDTSNISNVSDAFLAKFNSSGSRIWATYYGGNHSDRSVSCTVDGVGNVYFAGESRSKTGIAYKGSDSVYYENSTFSDYENPFLVKFDSSGSRLWGSYYGGPSYEFINSCTADKSGNLYLAGWAGNIYLATIPPTVGGFQNTYGGGSTDALIAKFDPSGTKVWDSYYGGESQDGANTCATDNLGNLYVTGFSLSTTGIAFHGFKEVLDDTDDYLHSGDAILAKIETKSITTLPLHLLSFTASLQTKAVNLAWQTAQEVNTSYFVIERSNNGNNYTALQRVTAGNYNGYYTAIDNSPLSGKNLYRLKMVDKDGTFMYSNAVSISYIIKNMITVSPNPATDKLTVQLQSISNAKASIRISDVNGKIVYTKQLPIVSGINTLSVPVASFAKGTYLLTVVQGNNKQTVKWVKE